MADRIWAGTRALAQMHLDAGQRVWLVTATPVELALIIARRLGLTGALGTVAESVDGYYTGRLVGELLHGPAKAHAVRALAVARGTRPAPVHGLLGLGERRPDALRWSGRRWPSTRTATCATSPAPSGWQIRDFRTGRRATRIAVPALLGRRGGRRSGRGPAPLGLAATTGAPTAVREVARLQQGGLAALGLE